MDKYRRKIVEALKQPEKIVGFFLNHGLGKLLPDIVYLSIMFKVRVGYAMDWKNPKSFNEKLQWLKVNEHYPERSNLVDKYEVRAYVERKIGEKYLIPLLGVWNSFEEINFDELPHKFVLKCTHDSGGVMICQNIEQFDTKNAKVFLKEHLKRNFYKSGREFPYKTIKPRIIAEQYLEQKDGHALRDYKLLCFNGKVKCSFVCSNRNTDIGLCVNFYDKEWNPMPFERHYPKSLVEIEKPRNYELMVQLAEKLAADFRFVRVDFYEIENQVYFGELTFYPGSGLEEFTPREYDYLLGSWIEL